MLESGLGAGAASMTGNDDVVGVGLGDARGDGADAATGDELDADGGARVGALEIPDELREIFDGVDVVVRRRGDELHARLRVTQAGDEFRDLVAGKLSAFAGLGALRDFDFEFFGVSEVLGGDAEACAGNLLDLVVEQRRRAVDGSVDGGSSPPSPVLERAPSMFMASVMVWCASGESEPNDMALATKVRVMVSAGAI